MATLETQYKNFLKDNPNAKIHFEAWKKINTRLVEQSLVNMMKVDEELGLYDEPFKHKVEMIPAEEILANRSNAYEFIDFDKQETLEEFAETFVKNRFTKQICGDEFYPDIYASKEAIVESHILFAKWQIDKQDAFNYSLNAFKVPKEYFGKEEPKQETLEEIDEWLFKSEKNLETFIRGAKLQQERMYSEEEVKNIMAETWIQCVGNDGNNFKELRDKILKQFKNK